MVEVWFIGERDWPVRGEIQAFFAFFEGRRGESGAGGDYFGLFFAFSAGI